MSAIRGGMPIWRKDGKDTFVKRLLSRRPELSKEADDFFLCDRVKVIHENFFDIAEELMEMPELMEDDVFFFFDPPYPFRSNLQYASEYGKSKSCRLISDMMIYIRNLLEEKCKVCMITESITLIDYVFAPFIKKRYAKSYVANDHYNPSLFLDNDTYHLLICNY